MCKSKGVYESPAQAKEPEIHMCLLLGVLQKDPASSYIIYSDDLMQSLAGPMFTASVSVYPCEPYLVDSVTHVFLVFSIPSSA